MNLTQKAIIRTLLYFDMFGHPLDHSELYELISTSTDRRNFNSALDELILSNVICRESGLLFLRNGNSSPLNRITKLKLSDRYYRIAYYVSILISWHPFVRGVMISGSLSKNSLSKKDDIDFFIIARSGRVWLCKGILMLFKKIFLLNSKKYFCINYIIDTGTLEIPEKNIFTATELAFLIPMRNTLLCRDFLSANNWVNSFFPNFSFKMNGCRTSKDPWLKKAFEFVLDGKIGDRLDSWFMELYRKRILKRYRNDDPVKFNLNFKNEKNVSKYHPNGFQHIIIEKYKQKISEFEYLNSLNL